MTGTISIKRVTESDADQLLDLSRKTFFDAFAHLNNPADMEAYAAMAFRHEKLLSELLDPDTSFYFAFVDSAIAGYIKLNTGSAQTEFKDEDGLEVERIYVHAAFQGRQVGNQLLNFAINAAIEHQHPYIWLGVWEHNHGAIRFYERNGFKPFSTHSFMQGSDTQTDILMKRGLIFSTEG
jgi:ribosomal protein S18 acetylase RimI-like enzyme